MFFGTPVMFSCVDSGDLVLELRKLKHPIIGGGVLVKGYFILFFLFVCLLQGQH